METTTQNFEERLKAFVAHADEQKAAYWKASGFTFAPPPTHEYEIGEKWAKIWQCEIRNGVKQRSSVYAFVCVVDGQTKTLGVLKCGDIHKPASYKAPAKIARGNIFLENFGQAIQGGTCIKYLK